jgi:N-succinyldiaminopimelate aminotransferase
MTDPMMNHRLDQLGDYAFRRLDRLIDGVVPATNEAPLKMSLGEPQHAPPPLLAETLTQNAHLWNRYPPVAGTPDWRQAVAEWLTTRYRLPAGLIDPDKHLLPAAGTREALFMVSLVCVEGARSAPTPAVLMPNPYYQVYSGGGVMAGGEPVYLNATRETGFLPDLDALTPTLLERTAVLFMCSPANPQGAVASFDYWKRALGLARQYGFTLLADECYSEIYSDTPPPGALEAAAATGSLDNLLVFNSLSKRSSSPGLRCGLIAGDARLIAMFTRLRSYGGAGVPLPTIAAAAALYRDETHVEANRALYRAKFDAAARIFGTRHGFYRPGGGFFLWLDVGDGEAAARTIWREAGVTTLPGGYLARPDAAGFNPGAAFVRIALVHDVATVTDGLTRVARALARHERSAAE